ncbi:MULTISPECIES: S1 family peptidase [unclassified Amycolatopsis]|uniref:S1 family peptidase n=1 Tax=unclassified Amycolatopsis TaxID=2618356 RepID=UPI002876A2C8|nr:MULTISPECIES: S1 family peptidase [unclassified Amycolatopsis]MDS0137855.1 S1 family peptidase [Amycolatopsis sp. 505]MDS0144232.1 S1 family peptidase [Amycolatopsis sp. CM201R]
MPGRAGATLAAVAVAGLLAAVPASAVTGGSPAAAGAYTFATKIDVGGLHGCSGALVAPQWVVTAAGCFPENGGQAGPPKLATKAIVGQRGAAGTERAVVDLLFRADRNLALAKLAAPVTGVTPVAIGTAAPAPDEVLRIAGYGRTATEWVPDQLHTVPASVQSVTATTLAVLGDPAAATTCQGDAGGPLLRERNGVVELAGIHHASWQAGCLGSTETRQGTVETRVDDIAGWIGLRLRGDAYTALPTAQRVLDTRTDTGGHQKPVAAGESVSVAIPGLPAAASAVAVSLVGTGGTASTFLTAYGDALPTTSNVNITGGRTAAGMAIVPVGADGRIKVRNNAGTIDVIVDYLGYYSASGESTYQPKDKPGLVLDTRTSLGGHPGRLTPGEVVTVPVRGVAGVPADAVAVAVNLTGTESDSDTFFSVFAQGTPGPSTLNIVPNEHRATQSLVRIGDDGAIRIFLHHGQSHVLLSLVGSFVPGDTGSRYAALGTPTRLVDTRTGPAAPLGPGGIVTVPAAGLPSGATAVAVNVTGVQPSATTFLAAWSHDLPYSGVPSTVNVMAGENTSNAATVRLGSGARFDVLNSAGSTHLVVDLQGYYTR